MINVDATNMDLLSDPKWYLENLTKIKSKNSGLVPFILNEMQKDLFNTIERYNRIILLKARQLGSSTGSAGYLYHRTIMNPGMNTAIIGYNSALTAELLDKIKTFYRTTPDELKPTIHYNSKFEISFPKIDSKIIILPSTENVGRGYTLNNVLLTELAFWDKAEDKMAALESTVPIDGKIIIESTPNGQGNLYHRMWMIDNDYIKKEYGWWWLYSERELEIIKKRINDPRKFAQEYSLEFLAAGRPVFETEVIKQQRKYQLNIGDKNILQDGTEYIVNKKDDFEVYAPPLPGHFYVIGGDVAEGVSGGDYSTATIWDRTSGEQVAFYRGYIAPDKFGDLLNKVGRSYNNGLMVVEVNNHGLTTLTILKQLMYPSLYFRPSKFESIDSPWSDKLGWRTTRLTRPLLIDDFAKALRENALKIRSKQILDEMTVFVYNDAGDMQPQSGFHDDGIFSSAIGYQGFKIMISTQPEQINYQKHLPNVGY